MSGRCERCKYENPDGASHCEQCGHDLGASKAVSLATHIGSSLAGILCGVVAYMLILILGELPPFSTFHAPPNTGQYEFVIARGSAIFYAVMFLAVIALLIALLSTRLRDRIPTPMRTLVFAALFVLLGGLAICGMFSAGQIFDSSF